jgi:hypothetical protein
VSAFILIIRASSVEQNVLGDHVVAVKHGDEDTIPQACHDRAK